MFSILYAASRYYDVVTQVLCAGSAQSCHNMRSTTTPIPAPSPQIGLSSVVRTTH